MNFFRSRGDTDRLRRGDVSSGKQFADAIPVTKLLPVGKDRLAEADQLLSRYKEGKTNLERKIIDNDLWYRLRHWECMRNRDDRVKPVSGWLFNCIANKHADAIDNFPMPNILPREEGDKAEAEMLSSILPVVLDNCNFEQVYSDVWMYKLKVGTGVYGVFWDKSLLNGLGDIAIKKIDLLNLFWEPGITDIQDSRNLFCVELVDNDILEASYPQLRGRLGGSGFTDIAKYSYDDTVDTSGKSKVVDWYYRKSTGGRTVLHYCKYVGDTVLFSTENDPNFSQRGLYDHASYPFVFDTLFPIEGTPVGFGYIDVGKDAQGYIDRGNQAILENLLANTKPRHFVRTGSINEEEYADLGKDFVHVTGSLDENNIKPIVGKPLSDIYVSVINNKIDELKETTGNRDVSNGGTTSGVTAASAIAAMQEAGSKLSRDNIKASYRAFRRLCLLCVELIRQFYDQPRCFRIMGEGGTARFVRYSNEHIQPQSQGIDFGCDMGFRKPLFDIEITAQKQSPYSKMSQNELALQFYSAGFFAPQMSDQALACLEMMDFDRKSFIMQRIAANRTLYDRVIELEQQLSVLAHAVNGGGASMPVMPQSSAGDLSENTSPGTPGEAKLPDTGTEGEEPATVRAARQRVADSTSPT